MMRIPEIIAFGGIAVLVFAGSADAQNCGGTVSGGVGGVGGVSIGTSSITISAPRRVGGGPGSNGSCIPPNAYASKYVLLSDASRAVLKGIKLAKPESDSAKALERAFRIRELKTNEELEKEFDRDLQNPPPRNRAEAADRYVAGFNRNAAALLKLQAEYLLALRAIVPSDKHAAFDANREKLETAQTKDLDRARKDLAASQ